MSETYENLAIQFESESDGVRDAAGELVLLLRTQGVSGALSSNIPRKEMESVPRRYTGDYLRLREQIPSGYTSAFLFRHFCATQARA